MTLTRGSRSDYMPANARLRVPGMREWGRRNLSFSGDWVSKLRNRSGSRNTSVTPTLQGRSREPSGDYCFRISNACSVSDYDIIWFCRRKTQVPVDRLRKSRTPPTSRSQTFRLQRTRRGHHLPAQRYFQQSSTSSLCSPTHQPSPKYSSRS